MNNNEPLLAVAFNGGNKGPTYVQPLFKILWVQDYS